MDAPWFPGFSVVGPEALSGYDRDIHLVENEDEVLLLFDDGGQHRFECSYCSREYRARSGAAAVRWFHGHDCVCGAASEAA